MSNKEAKNINEMANSLQDSSRNLSSNRSTDQNLLEKSPVEEEKAYNDIKESSFENINESPLQKNISPFPAKGKHLNSEKNPFAVYQSTGQINKNPFQVASEFSKKGPVTSETTVPGMTISDNQISSKNQMNENSKSFGSGASLKIENVGLPSEDIIPGELLVTLIKCTVMPAQYPAIISKGQLIITNYRVMFKSEEDRFFAKYPLKDDYLKIPLGFIFKLDYTTDKRDPSITNVDVYSKDGRTLRFRFNEGRANESSSILRYLQIYSFPDKKDYFFAFDYYKAAKDFEEKYQGWKIYDIEKEFKRQGVDFLGVDEKSDGSTNHLFRIIENKAFRFCSTYPELLLVPSRMSSHSLVASAKFRTRERLPVITYYYAKKRTLLSRSSQSKPGLTQSRCIEDELLLRYLGNPHYDPAKDLESSEVNLYIFDARPYLNAVANRVGGKGYEDTRWYKNCEIDFMDIDNIHHVRDAHKKLLNLCFSPDIPNAKWYSQLESTNWLEIISYILAASSKVAQCLDRGKNVLVHCSDGWDRTAQILSLAQIMLDPYFRTIEGFEVLIMKEWVHFGHQFSTRMGHGNKNDKDEHRSPVFLQFLDCVQQLMHQYPFAFEFNNLFLVDLAYHSYSCKFGTFLCSSYQELLLYQMETRTISIWSYLNSQKEKYKNPYHGTVQGHESLVLRPITHSKSLRLWEEYFLYYSWLSKPNFSLSDQIMFNEDFYLYMFQKEKERSEALRAELEQLKKEKSLAFVQKDGNGVKALNLEGDIAQSQTKCKEEEEIVPLKEQKGELISNNNS